VDSYLRRALRIALSGAVCVLAVLAAGRIAERLILGGNDAATRARVDRDIRGAFDVMSRGLQDVARRVANPETLDAAARDDENAARRLFDAAQAATVAHTSDVELAVTAYGPDSRALAWAGRPSELPRDRLEGDEAWFIAQGALGLRLVYAMPVTDGTGNRIGTIASEQAIRRPSSNGAVTRADEFQFPGELIPVSLELAFEDIRTTPDPDRIDVKGPNGRHLVTAVITPTDLAEARGLWRRMTASLAEMTAAVLVLLLCGPLLDWRDAWDWGSATRDSKDAPKQRTESRLPNPESRYILAVVTLALAILAARLLFRLASPADWSDAEIFSAAVYASPLLRPFLASPFDFLITAATAAGLVAIAFFAFEAWRVRRRHARVAVDSPGTVFLFLAAQLAAGGVAVGVVLAQYALLADTVANTTLDLLHFSLHPWNTALTALQFAIVIWDTTAVAALVLIFRAAYLPWRIARRRWSVRVAALILLVVADSYPCRAQHTEQSVAARARPRRVGRARGHSTQRPIPPRFAGVPADAALHRTRSAGAGVLRGCLRAGESCQNGTGRNTLRTTGAEPAANDSVADAAESPTDRCVSRTGGSCLGPARTGWIRGGHRPRIPGLADYRSRDVSGHVVCRALRPGRPSRQPFRIQPAGRPQRAPHVGRTRLLVGTSSRKCRRSSQSNVGCSAPAERCA
jgi:hypothetical protein